MEYQVIIIGGGPAGYTAAEAAAKGGLSVLLIEKNALGGVCLNEGCIPTKTLLYSAKLYDSANHAARYGIQVEGAAFDLPKIAARKNKVVRKLVLGIKNRLTACGVTMLQGEAQIVDGHTVACGEETYRCENLVVCTGSETVLPPIPGADSVACWTHREALECRERPESLLVVGGGVIGMEFAAFFSSLGTKVTVIEAMPGILGDMDGETASMLCAEYAKRGVRFLLSTRVTSLAPSSLVEGGTAYTYEGETSGTGHAERVLLCVGRRPVLHGFGLENLPMERTDRGLPVVNERMQTSLPHVYVCGDLTGRSMLAHTAVREAEVAVHSILGKEDAMSYRAIPGVVYTNPEVAGVGETEESARRKGLTFRVAKLPMAYSGRFVAENEGQNGLCKLLIDSGGHIIGAHMLGNPASEIITLAGMAVELNLTVDEWKKVVFPHPTAGEIFKELLA